MIPALMSDLELQWLEKQALEHSAIVEIGCWLGGSTQVLANTHGFVLCVDDWSGTERGFLPTDVDMTKYPDGGFVDFCKNMKILLGKVIPLRMKSQKAFTLFPAPCFDMVFIDGDHKYDSVWLDIYNWRRLLKPDGLLCGHNYEDCWKDDVVRAVDELVPNKNIVPGTSIWWTTI